MKVFIAAVALCILAGCATTQPGAPVEVKVAVPVKCVADEPAVPTWAADLLEKGATVYEMVRALLADEKVARAYEDELRAALRSCK